MAVSLTNKSQKCPTSDKGEPESKNQGKLLHLKLNAWKRLDAGKRAEDTGRALGLLPMTVRTVCSNADKIRASVRNYTIRCNQNKY